MNKIDIKSLTLNELEECIVGWGYKKFVARQVFMWLHEKGVKGYEEMTNVPKALREKLSEAMDCSLLTPVKVLTSKIDGTCKFLFKLSDGNVIESVLMRYKHGNSVCISSQVGCRMGCRFCASTLDGLTRNLLPGEMLEQIYRIQEYVGERVSNVVIMGSGEPLDNYENVVKFVELLSCEAGINISGRNLTISTCGLVPKIMELADMKKQFTLAISLHAPNDQLRKTMMPIANKYSISELIDACKYYYKQTGRRISFEYSLVKDVNDSLQCAAELAELIEGMNCHINLIPVNPIKERDYEQTQLNQITKFKNYLEKCGKNVTIRREMGRDINGACGQLRKDYIEG